MSFAPGPLILNTLVKCILNFFQVVYPQKRGCSCNRVKERAIRLLSLTLIAWKGDDESSLN